MLTINKYDFEMVEMKSQF